MLHQCYNQHDHQYYLPETTSASSSKTPLSNIKLELGLFTDPCIKLNDIDIFFVFSSCMSNDILQLLAYSLGRQVRVGSYVITTDYPLPLKGVVPKHIDIDTDQVK